MDFHENQRIEVSWLRWLFIISGVTILGIVVFSVISGAEETDDPGLYVGLFITFATLGLTYWMVFKSELETAVAYEGFQYKYVPFVIKWHTISWQDIASWEMIKLSDHVGFVGYGYGYKKQAFKKITSFIMGGNEAVRFTLANGRTYVFNTRMPIDLQRALNKYLSNKQLVK